MEGDSMKIPKNMTKQEVLETIDIIINRIAPKYTFQGYEVDDIKQEAFLICADALHRYDPSRPLENFLSVNLSNRLKNFVRDNNYTKSDERKKKALLPVSLSNDDHIEDHRVELSIDTQEIIELVDEEISIEYRADYLKIINGVHVPKKRKLEVIEHIKDILDEKGCT
jgi:DNA-directed RNA polymerase specialized sigma24 family protein